MYDVLELSSDISYFCFNFSPILDKDGTNTKMELYRAGSEELP